MTSRPSLPIAGLGRLRNKSFFRFRPLGSRVLVTDVGGRWSDFSVEEFGDWLGNARATLVAMRPQAAGTQSGIPANIPDSAALRQRLSYIFRGPAHFGLVITTKQLSEGEGHTLSADHVERAIDTAFMTTSPRLTLHLVGGEPLREVQALRHAIDYARRKNLLARKYLGIRLNTRLEGLDHDTLRWLADERVLIALSIHGPLDVHNAVADGFGSASLADAKRWLPAIREAYLDAGVPASEAHAEVNVRVSDVHEGRGADTAIALLECGARRVSISPQRPLLGATALDRPALQPDAFRDFFESALAVFAETSSSDAATELTVEHVARRVLGDEVPADTRWRSPALEGIGELACGPDGIVTAGLEGWALHHAGDSAFALAHVTRGGYHDLVVHPTVRALAVASALEGQPEWASCAYAPYLASWPMNYYVEQGSIHGRLQESPTFLRQVAFFDAMFDALADPASTVGAAIRRWAQQPIPGAFHE